MRTFLILLALGTALHADVLRVAASGGTHTSFLDAMADAQDGDVILIDPNLIVSPAASSVTVTKSVTIIGDGANRGAMPTTVVQVPAGKQVVLRNLRFEGGLISVLLGGTLWIRSSEGAVHVEDCEFLGWYDPFASGGTGGVAATITDSSAVSIARCHFEGGAGASTFNTPPIVVGLPGDGGQGLRLVNSSVSIHDSVLIGGRGGSDFDFGGPGRDGELGLRSQNSDVWLVGCEVTGGARGLGNPNGLPASGAELVGLTQHTRRLDSTFTGGGMAAPITDNGTPITSWGGVAIDFRVKAPVRPGETGRARVTGPQGTTFGIFISFGPGFFPKDAFHGVVIPELTTFTGPLFLAAIPADGTYALDFIVPTFGLDAFVNVDQVFSDQGADGIVLSGASAWVQVENGF